MAKSPSVVVWGPERFKKKITIGLVVTVEASVKIEFADEKYEIVLDLGDFGTRRLPLPEDKKVIEKVAVVPGVTFVFAAERRDKADEKAGYRLVGKLDIPIFPDIQVFAVVVKFAKIPAVKKVSPFAMSAETDDQDSDLFVAFSEDVPFSADVFDEARL